MIVIVLMWLILIFAGIRYTKDIKNGAAFSKENSMALRGICSIEIMMGHLGLATKSIVLFPNRKAGILFVGVFFALSGYGLMYSLQNKDNYLKSFLSDRLFKLLIPAYVIYVIGVLLKSDVDWVNIFRPDRFVSDTNWYVWEMLAMYIAFYLCARLMDMRKGHIILFVLSLIFVCAAYALNLDRPWYGSTFCFWLGIFYFINQEKFKEVLVSKHWILNVMILSICMIISMGLFFVKEDWMGGALLGRNIASVSFVIIVIICLYRFKLGNFVSLRLGQYSYEIFLFHPVFIKVLRPYIMNYLIYSFAVIAITIIAAVLYREIWKYGINKSNKK